MASRVAHEPESVDRSEILNVAYWHFASFAALQHFGSYWGKSGHGRASRLARLCVHSPLVKTTDSAVTDIVGAGNIRQHLTGLKPSYSFLALMSCEFWL